MSDASVKTQKPDSEQKEKTIDKLHLMITLVLVGMSYIFWDDFYSFRQKAPKLGIEMRELSDLIYIVLGAIVINLLRRILDASLRRKLEPYLCQSLQDIELRREKLVRQIFDTIYYFSIFALGRYIAIDTDFIPGCIGGAGDCSSLGNSWPRMKLTEKMRVYIIIQFSHHLHNLFYHTFSMKSVGNYFEMITHHYATVVSLFYSYFTNWEDNAFIILICHDLSDGFLNFGKVLRDLGWGSTMLMNVNFVLLLFYWFYHRTYIIASCYFYTNTDLFWWKHPYPENEDLWLSVRRGVNFIIFNIFIIWVMNIFWWTLIVKIGVNTFVKKKKWVSTHEGEVDVEEVEKKQQASKPSDDAPSTPFAVDPAPVSKKLR